MKVFSDDIVSIIDYVDADHWKISSDWRDKFIESLSDILCDPLLYHINNKGLLVSPNYYNDIYDQRFALTKVRSIPAYDAFYPEFYMYWEIFYNTKILTNVHNIGYLVESKSTKGALEAAIKWCETYTKYEDNRYFYISLSKTSFDTQNRFSRVYRYFIHEFDIQNRNDIYGIIKYYNDKKFDCILADTDNPYSMISLTFINIGGKAIIKSKYTKSPILNNMISSLYSFFKSIDIYRPDILHPLDSSIYIICTNLLHDISYEFIQAIVNNKYALCSNIPQSIKKILYNLDISYTENILTMMNFLQLDNDTLKPKKIDVYNDSYVSFGLKWAKDNDMIIKSFYSSKISEFKEHNYTSYTFMQHKIDIIEDNDNDKYYDILHANKRRLNRLKRIIDTKDQFIDNDYENDIIDWNKLTNCIDLYRYLKRTIAWKFGGEMVTNAWTKLYEILDKEKMIFSNKHGVFKVFHLCEAPGSFIMSLNHYIKTKTNITKYIWFAQTLNPFHINNKNKLSVLKDDFGLIKKYPQRWLFDKSGEGDVTQLDVIKDYVTHPMIIDFDLITGDAGLKIPPSLFNEQESYVAKVIFGEVLTILLLLPIGKTCIFKAFIPFAETLTISLLYILTTLFETMTIHKPLSSHPSSSEVYIVCKNYRGKMIIEESVLKTMYDILDNFDVNRSIVPKNLIPTLFLEKLIECSNLFVEKQMCSINRSLYYRYKYYNDYNEQDRISAHRDHVIENWLKIYDIHPINSKDKILKN